MQKHVLIFYALIFSTMTGMAQTGKTFYDFKVKTLEGDNFDLASLKGKKVLVVNTASKCGFTPQYADLEKLFVKYGGDQFTIIGFPANNFLQQEPGSDKEIRQFCTREYGVTFPMMGKISVKGKDMAPVYKWLTSKSENGVMDSEVKWNFQKYLIDENGKLVKIIPSKEKPDSEEIVNWIKGK
jgi:glutathione peroxidase